jgi:hypothetical protein
MSIGLQNPISGSYGTTFVVKNGNPTLQNGRALGGGIRGFIPVGTNDTDNNDLFAQTRFTLKNAWNTQYQYQLKRAHLKRVITPFRAVNNSGDLLSRKYYSCGGPCQTFQHRPGLYGIRNSLGSIQNHCDGTDVPPASCNVKYVYDSSDYITFLKQQAISKNYNDLSYSGNNYSGSQVAYRAIRRY